MLRGGRGATRGSRAIDPDGRRDQHGNPERSGGRFPGGDLGAGSGTYQVGDQIKVLLQGEAAFRVGEQDSETPLLDIEDGLVDGE